MGERAYLTVFVSAPDGADERFLAAVKALEEVFDRTLGFTLDADGSPETLADRDEWVHQRLRSGTVPLVCTGTEDDYLQVTGNVIDETIGPGGQRVVELSARLPAQDPYLSRTGDALVALSDAMDAYWGCANPNDTGAVIGRQVVHAHVSSQPPMGLPALAPRHEMASPLVPRQAGWINYWSRRTCQRLDDVAERLRDECWYGTWQNPDGSWTVQLTDTPLDLDVPSHREALDNFYSTFPEIGDSEA